MMDNNDIIIMINNGDFHDNVVKTNTEGFSQTVTMNNWLVNG